ncbi:Dipeptidylaminopeptidase/acylaminoacyl-peptidase -like protein [Pirellula staleyi DSM 6068]|uniref:Dipeptidylaminopeptidase/acylaminoacyl-peptidase-like protein n=1 Tax=Pirellula staleyi (strain ATCC 27377 / DSM 6068 / ICPB 4128) TaxID=530564 RepID=D2R5Y7_PIRSD|nr:acetylxylan esterase [Pirellula staleyi]ADB19072.1 Dipeptidylaminopeptidase/acylaminoacyl-peptidase -like protein [Pirellula staleyi DSM 6068]
MRIILLMFLVVIAIGSRQASAADAPVTVKELFADFDPRKAPLDAKVVREWEKDGIVFRYVTYHIGAFKDKPARMAAFFAFPKKAKKLPGLLHVHGGGQRAFLHEVEFYAKRGYACLSVNWGGREMEEAKEGDPNTAWGAVDPTQNNVPGYFNLKPGEKYLDPFESPRNNNWYLLTLGCRRGLTFLEQQPEVDPDKLGVYGHSMGGNLTVYVAGTDGRVKAAAPSVGGSGFRTQPWPLLPQHKPQMPNGDVKLFDATLGFEAYAPHITAPLLWLGATNDFHGIMDDTYRTGELIPHKNVRYSFTPHMNHRFTPEFAVTRPLWFDQHLKGSFTFPKTPESHLSFEAKDHVPMLEVMPDSTQDVIEVHIFYSLDPDPRARFWRSAEVQGSGDTWTGKLPILSVDQPLFAFANVVYRLKQSESEPHARPTERFALSSTLHTFAPKDVAANGASATDKVDPLIDDFTHSWRDWYTLSPDNPHHWEFSTRKLTDPKWRGHDGQRLTVEVQTEKPNELVIVLTENFFRQYRGKQREFLAVVNLDGGKETQRVMLEPKDFKTSDGEVLSSWSNVDLLSFRAYDDKGEKLVGSKCWAGPQPVFKKLWWQ